MNIEVHILTWRVTLFHTRQKLFCPHFILANLASDFQVVLAKWNFHSPWRVLMSNPVLVNVNIWWKWDRFKYISSINCMTARRKNVFWHRATATTAGADPENIEPVGANNIKYLKEQGAQCLFALQIRANRGRTPGTPSPFKSAPRRGPRTLVTSACTARKWAL